MSAMPMTLPMTSPQHLQEFGVDFETARAGISTALLGLQAERDEKRNKDTVRRTRLTKLEVGRALHRMHATESWRGSEHTSWTAVCRALNCRRQDSYELMNAAAIHDGLPPSVMEDVPPEGFSKRQYLTLGRADQEEREETIHAAAESGDPAAAFAALSQSLDEDPDDELDLGEMPEKPKADHNLSWFKRWLTTGHKAFQAKSLEEEVRPFLDGIRKVLGLEEAKESA